MNTPPIRWNAPWLAPLAGFSDLPFRLLCREQGAAVAVTEMVSAKGLLNAGPANERLLTTCDEDSPMVVQLFGPGADTLGRAARLLAGRGFAWLDLNCGCSVPKVVKARSGAALLQDPNRLVACAKAMVDAVAPLHGPGRVGVKFRTGWCQGKECHTDIAKRLEDVGVGWLTLHPRYARQGFAGQAAWERLAEVKQAVSLPVMASGDLWTAEDALECRNASGVDGVMYARGALRNPAVFAAHMALAEGRPQPVLDGPFLAKLIQRHVDLIHTYGQPGRELLKLRTVVPRYVRNLRGAGKLRAQLTRLNSYQELQDILPEIAALEPENQEIRTPNIPGTEMA